MRSTHVALICSLSMLWVVSPKLAAQADCASRCVRVNAGPNFHDGERTVKIQRSSNVPHEKECRLEVRLSVPPYSQSDPDWVKVPARCHSLHHSL